MNLFLDKISLTLISLASGIIFGFLLRKAAVTRSDTILKQLLLKDFTVMKVILTAILVGSIGIYCCHFIKILPRLHLSTTPILWTLIGGGVFGIGMALLGYCPGTAIAAMGEGSQNAFVGVLGMLTGAAVFNQFSFIFLPIIEKPDPTLNHTIATYFNIPVSVVITGIFLFWTLLVILTYRKDLRKANKA